MLLARLKPKLILRFWEATPCADDDRVEILPVIFDEAASTVTATLDAATPAAVARLVVTAVTSTSIGFRELKNSTMT